MFQNVIFDLDGTLLNTIDDLADAANWVCARHGWPLHTVEEYKRFVGNGIPRLVERFAPAPERTPEGLARALEEFSERYGAHRADKTAPYAGMPEAVERLRAAGVRTAVLYRPADDEELPIFSTGMIGQYAHGNSPEYLLEDRWHRADLYDPNSEWLYGTCRID